MESTEKHALLEEVYRMSIQRKSPKLFISHSTLDISYVSYLIRLLELLGMNSDNLFCSSAKGYGIPLDGNIYDYLRDQFRDFDLRVLFILSDNYYNSVASMNEMGAAWVLQHKYTSVLLPRFEFKNIKGAIDPRRISIKLDAQENELKDKLNGLKDTLRDEFSLLPIKETVWETYRDEFITKVQKTASLWAKLRWLKENEKPASSWISSLNQLLDLDPNSFDVLYMLGVQYSLTGDTTEAIIYLRKAELVAPDKIMREKVNHMIQNLTYGQNF